MLRLLLVSSLATALTACASAGIVPAEDISRTRFAPALGVDLGAMQRTPTGLYVAELATGGGAPAQARQLVAVRYTGWLADGTKVDESTGLEFRLGTGRVIRGWDEGIDGMRVGGVRRLVIPPELAYGFKDAGPIPRGSVLVFRIELLRVR